MCAIFVPIFRHSPIIPPPHYPLINPSILSIIRLSDRCPLSPPRPLPPSASLDVASVASATGPVLLSYGRPTLDDLAVEDPARTSSKTSLWVLRTVLRIARSRGIIETPMSESVMMLVIVVCKASFVATVANLASQSLHSPRPRHV